MEKIKVTFDESATEFVLEALGYSTDKEGYVIDIDGKRVLDKYFNKEIKAKEIGGFYKGGIVNGDICSIIRLHEDMEIEEN